MKFSAFITSIAIVGSEAFAPGVSVNARSSTGEFYLAVRVVNGESDDNLPSERAESWTLKQTLILQRGASAIPKVGQKVSVGWSWVLIEEIPASLCFFEISSTDDKLSATDKSDSFDVLRKCIMLQNIYNFL